MISYKDKSFCSERNCINPNCSLLLTREDANNAKVWWNKEEEDIKKWTDAPIAFSNYRDTEYCPGYKKGKIDENENQTTE